MRFATYLPCFVFALLATSCEIADTLALGGHGGLPADSGPSPTTGQSDAGIRQDAATPTTTATSELDAGQPYCVGLAEDECLSRRPCLPYYCPGCRGDLFYQGCIPPNVGDSGCPDVDCPEMRQCGALDERACAASPKCHPVYEGDPRSADTCDPLPGCGAAEPRFSFCADGPQADCAGPAGCRKAPPACIGGTVISYVDSCYEGCARSDDCR